MDTPASLLERLRQPTEQISWSRFVRLYTPLLYSWARRLGLQSDEAGDLVQDVFTLLLQKLPTFHYNGQKRFRGWLWTVTVNKWRENRRRQSALAPVGLTAVTEPAVADPIEEISEAEYRAYVLRRIQHLMQVEFPPATWRAYWEHVACGKPAPQVAADLGISVGAVYVAKCRVLRRLREELAGLLD